MYGNKLSSNPNQPKIFPYIMSKILDYFSFKYSRFNYSKSKEATARITLYKEVQIPTVFTMEASFCGANQGELDGYHFNTDHFARAGKALFDALIVHQRLDVQLIAKQYGLNKDGAPANDKDYKDLKIDDLMKDFQTTPDN